MDAKNKYIIRREYLPLEPECAERIKTLQGICRTLREYGVQDRDAREHLRSWREKRRSTLVKFTISRSKYPNLKYERLWQGDRLNYTRLRDLRDGYKYALQTYRSQSRRIPLKYERWLGADIPKRGDIFETAGLILHVFKSTKNSRVFQDKKPRTSERHVGIEIEFLCPYEREKLIDKVYELGLQSYITIKTDGSIRNNQCDCYGQTNCKHKFTHEICLIAPESEYKSIVRRCGEFFEDISASVNTSCGLHVHLDMRDRRPRKSFRNLVLAQGLLYGMQPKSRRENTFCVPYPYTKLNSKQTNRYFGVNGASVRKHKTIEIRMHSGTTNADKIINWVSLLISIVNAKKLSKPINYPSEIGTQIKISNDLMEYVKLRTERFVGIDASRFQYPDVA